MKKLLVVLLLISFSVNAQIKVVEKLPGDLIGYIGPKKSPWIKIEKFADTYVVSYQDLKFQQLTDYKTFEFKDEDDALENLYNVMLEGLNNPPKDDIIIELPDDYVSLNFTKAVGVANVRFLHSEKDVDVQGFSAWITKKRLDKLFGKSN